MEGLSIIIPVYNKIEITEKCIRSIFELNKDCVFEVIIVDNGSTDDTERVLKTSDKITYIRKEENLGVAGACNAGASAARYNVLCFMHNDVFVLAENWTAVISEFINETSHAGVVGLYGAKTLRKDGSFRGKSIVHAKEHNPSMTRRYEKAAVIDGLMLAIKKSAFKEIRGFSDDFTIHFYDKDLSMRAVKHGYVNYVLNIPFEHYCAITRSSIKTEDRVRTEAQRKFIGIWDEQLPVDVTTWQEKISYVFKRKKDS